MVDIKKKRNIKLILIIFLGIFLINWELYPLVSSNSNYTLSLEKGSKIFEVVYYDEEAWKECINATSNPTDWFGGESDTIGAKSKTTILGTAYGGIGTYGLFIRLFFRWLDINNSFLWQHGYDQRYFITNYGKEYISLSPQLTSWSFGSEPFDNYSNCRIHDDESILFQKPSSFQSILNEYNNFAAVVNNDTVMQAINFSMPILNGDDFLWYFILARHVMVNPFNNYLTEVINVLECENVSVQENIITFMRYEEKAYITEFTFSSQGSLDTVIVKKDNGSLIYKITSTNPQFVVYIVIGICSGAILGLIGLSFYRKRRGTFLLKSTLN